MIYFYFTCLMSIILNNSAMKCISMFHSLTLTLCFMLFYFPFYNFFFKIRKEIFIFLKKIKKNRKKKSEIIVRSCQGRYLLCLENCNIYGIVKEAVEISGSYYLLSFFVCYENLFLLCYVFLSLFKG